MVAFFLVGWMLYPEMPTTLAQHFSMVPLILFTLAVPLPFGALGVTELVGGQLLKLVGHPDGELAMMGFRVLMYGAGLICACVYLAKLKEVRELTSAAKHLDDDDAKPEAELAQPSLLGFAPDYCGPEPPLARQRGRAGRSTRDSCIVGLKSLRDLSRRDAADLMIILCWEISVSFRIACPSDVEPEEIMPPHSRTIVWIATLVLAGFAPAPGSDNGSGRDQAGSDPGAHQGPGLGRVRGPRAGHAGRREVGRLHRRAVSKDGTEARQPGRNVFSGRSAGWFPGEAGDRSF